MKKILYIVLLFVFASLFCKGQTLSQQLTQSHWIEARKDSFIGKPFSVLYNALSLKPKSVWGCTGHSNRFVEFGHKFYYIGAGQYKDFYPYFYIDWTEPILISTAQQYQNAYLRAFNTQEYPIYANKIIEKIEVINPAE